MSTVTTWCNECGKHQYDFWFDAPDPSVGYPGGLSPEFDEDKCPLCGEPAPGLDAGERELLHMAEQEEDRRQAALEDRAEWQRDRDREVEWESKW